jgi:hypothetical protein
MCEKGFRTLGGADPALVAHIRKVGSFTSLSRSLILPSNGFWLHCDDFFAEEAR